MQALDADFLVFSGHKVFGPTGIGALYGKAHLLEAMPPWQGGGHMIEDVTFAKTVYKGAPEKFEAGTPDIAGAVGLGAALDYLQGIGLPAIAAYEHDLLHYAQAGLAEVKGLRLIGTAHEKASVMSFTVGGRRTRRSPTTSTPTASPCARATTAPCRPCAVSVSTSRCGPRSRSTTPATTWMCSSGRCTPGRGTERHAPARKSRRETVHDARRAEARADGCQAGALPVRAD